MAHSKELPKNKLKIFRYLKRTLELEEALSMGQSTQEWTK